MTFSIIIPVYNVAPYLRECLDSVLAQTYMDWEAICVDDGSTDGGGAILDEYAAKDKRFRVIHQPNAGVSAARNAALDVAQGDWLVFLDADDVIVNDALRILRDTSRADTNANMLRFDYRKFEEGEELPPQSLKDVCISRMDISKIVPDRYMDSYMWQYAVRRSMVHSIRFKPYIGGEDRLFIAEYMAHSGIILEIDNQLYGYRQRLDSAVHAQMSFRKLESELGYMLDLLSVCKNAGKKMSFLSVTWVRRFLCGAIIAVSLKLSWREGRAIWVRWREAIPFLLGFPEIRGADRIKLTACILLPFYTVAILVCYVMPRMLAGGSPMNWMRRKLYGKL